MSSFSRRLAFEGLPGGLDVLVDMKEIARVIPLLERPQPVVVARIGGPHPLFPFLAQVVDISPRRQWLQDLPEGLGPFDVRARFAIRPTGEDADNVGLPSLGKSRLCRVYAAGSAVEMLD